jgi:hypothetical protein
VCVCVCVFRDSRGREGGRDGGRVVEIETEAMEITERAR